MHIFKLKYGNWSVWNWGNPSNSSWLFRSICKVAEVLKSNFRISVCNPIATDLWSESCLLDLPINRKPTFINVNLQQNSFAFSNLLNEGRLDMNCIEALFGPNMDKNWLDKISFDLTSHNHWIWWPSFSKISIAPVVYEWINFLIGH